MNNINNNLTSAPLSAASEPAPASPLFGLRRPVIMGILNVTEDSFYDGGRYLTEEAVLAQARRLLAEGADIIDLGVVSSRPGAKLLAPEEEAAKLAPWVALLRKELPKGTPISVDTCFSLPAAKAVEAGADIVNDISGGQFDPQMFSTVASLKVRYILMHTKGTPDTMQHPENTRYGDIIADLSDYFAQKLEELEKLGVKEVWLDPGFGFAKTVEQNYEILYRLPELIARFPQHPMLVALSNKSMITKQLEKSINEELRMKSELPPHNTQCEDSKIRRFEDLKIRRFEDSKDGSRPAPLSERGWGYVSNNNTLSNTQCEDSKDGSRPILNIARERAEDELARIMPNTSNVTEGNSQFSILNSQLQNAPLPDSEYGTLALNALAIERGAQILRVHTPRPTLIASTLIASTMPPAQRTYKF